MLAAIKDIVAAKTHPYSTFDPASLTEDRQVQALLLHDAVRESAIFYHFSAYKLPTKKDGEKDSFDWTIGDGAATIGQAVSADYGVFLRIRGGWSSGARLAMMAVPYVGGSIPRIFQTASVTMVDLKTGKVVWAATASADSGVDIRTPEGAKDFAGKLFADAPL